MLFFCKGMPSTVLINIALIYMFRGLSILFCLVYSVVCVCKQIVSSTLKCDEFVLKRGPRSLTWTKESNVCESSRAGKLVGIMKTNAVIIALAIDKLTVKALSQNICVRGRKMVHYA